MAYLSPQQIGTAGTAVNYTAASAGGDTASPDERTFLHVKNASGGALVVTLVVPGNFVGMPLADPTVSVPAAGDRFIDLPTAMQDPTTGLVGVTYSAVTSLTVALLRA